MNEGSYYIGSCKDIIKRLNNHKNRQVFSTKHKLPFTIVYVKEFIAYKEARKEEIRIKNWKKRKSIENLCKFDIKNQCSKSMPPSSSGLGRRLLKA